MPALALDTTLFFMPAVSRVLALAKTRCSLGRDGARHGTTHGCGVERACRLAPPRGGLDRGRAGANEGESLVPPYLYLEADESISKWGAGGQAGNTRSLSAALSPSRPRTLAPAFLSLHCLLVRVPQLPLPVPTTLCQLCMCVCACVAPRRVLTGNDIIKQPGNPASTEPLSHPTPCFTSHLP
jgi:hypothetical protein